jgi:hypothetical protein
MWNKKTIAIFMLVFCVASYAQSGTYTGRILKIEFGPIYGDIVHLDMEGDTDTACASNAAGFDFSFDATTEIGKLMFSTLLAAQRASSVVSISGYGTCTVNTWSGNTEDVRWIQSQ